MAMATAGGGAAFCLKPLPHRAENLAGSSSPCLVFQSKSSSNRLASRRLIVVRAAIVRDEEEEAAAAVPSTHDRSSSSSSSSLAARLERRFAALGEGRQRIQVLLDRASSMPRLPLEERSSAHRVMGCTAQVWLTAMIDNHGAVHFRADSDAELTRGFCAVLLEVVNGASAEDILALPTDGKMVVGIAAGGAATGGRSKANTWFNVLVTMQKRTRLLLARRQGRPAYDPFPSLVITAEDLKPLGDFAVAQAKYLLPDEDKVRRLAAYLESKRIGVVAHFYMDPEVQGVLVAAQKLWPHIHISDSLVMADRAVKMADAGCEAIGVLGVDFMSENARAILDQAGYGNVPVYRMSSERIGCSLAEAADSSEYLEFLQAATRNSPALHVIYINTSLETKARAHAMVPTITCTSSNVVQTVLQAFAELPDVTVWYGPDSYMGANLVDLFVRMSEMNDEAIASVHPMHNRQTIASLLPRLHFFNNGSCIVHDLFGKDVVARVRESYADAFQTAHFEVPGEMFTLAMEAKQRGMGTVGSTQNILDFIKLRVKEAVDRDFDDRLQFVLGTESGMITAIVGAVQDVLKAARAAGMKANVEVEIVFPVSSDAITAGQQQQQQQQEPVKTYSFAQLSIVPGAPSGEGCSVGGGCASCAYMKMNSLDSLLRVCELIKTPYESALAAHRVGNFGSDKSSVAELGCAPILYMRHFQSTKSLPQELKERLLS